MIAERGVTIKIYDWTTDDYVYVQPNDVKSVEIVQECDKLSKTIPESYGTVIINASETLLDKLLLKTELEVYYDGTSKMKLFVEKARIKEKNLIEIKGKDLFFVYDFLETPTFHWIQAPEDYFYKNAYEVLDMFLTECGVPFEIDDDVKLLSLSGVIEKGELFKKVLNALLFACGARVVAGDKFYIRPLTSQSEKKINSNQVIGPVTVSAQQQEDFSLKIPYVDYSSVETKFETRMETRPSSNNYGNWIDGDTKYGTTHFNKKTHQITVTMREQYDDVDYAWDMMTDVVINTKNVGSEQYTFNQNELSGVVREKNFFSAFLPDPDTLEPPYDRNYFEIEVIINRFGEKMPGEYKIVSDNPYARNINVSELTTINSANVKEVADRLYNDDIYAEEITCKVAERKLIREGKPYMYGEMIYGQGIYGQLKASDMEIDVPIYVGDVVNIDLGKTGVFTKVVTKQKYSIRGGNIIKDTVLR